MSYIQQFQRALETEFQRRVMVAAAVAAQNISSEASNTPNHANRVGLARSVAASPDVPGPYAFPFALAVAVNAAINDQSSDSDIQFTVNSVWDALAGSA